jgi:hypothetical protein
MKSTASKKTAAAAQRKQSFFQKGGQDSFFQPVGSRNGFFSKPSSGTATIQPKLTIGEPPSKLPGPKPFASLTPAPSLSLVQEKCAHCEKEEKLQEMEDEQTPAKEKIRQKPIFESNAEPPEDNSIQKKSMRSGREAPAHVETNLNASKGSGAPLPDQTRREMESSFGSDFSKVKIHDNSSAAQMNKNLNAQAFTHGNDIYFNKGKYDTNSKGGQHLLAHELTHVVQQKGTLQSRKIQRVSENCSSSPINVELISVVMDANGMANGAKLQREWFGNAAGGGPPDTTTVKMDWMLGFGRAKAIYDTIFNDKIFVNTPAKSQIKTLLGRLGKKNGDSFNFNLPVTQLDPSFYINHKVVDSTDVLDDLSAALGRFDMRVLVAGDISQGGLVTITDVGTYISDSFDFEGFQVLGCWDTCLKTVTKDTATCAGVLVTNGDYRDWRAKNGKGGDFKVYSDVKTTHLATPESFIWDTQKAFSSNFEISARLVSPTKISVTSAGGVRATISNCSYINPSRSPLPTDKIAISLVQEGMILDSKISEQVLFANRTNTAVWTDLKAGNYHLDIVFNSQPVNPGESVMGDILVETSES